MISRDITIKILGNQSRLDESIYVYEKDNGVIFNFKLMEYKYKYDKDPNNILNSNASDILEAYTTIVNPLGQELQQLNGEVVNDIVKFTLDKTYTDQFIEIGIYELQIHIKCTHAEFSIPTITFEVLQRLKGKSIADSAQADITEIQDEVARIDVVDGILNVVWSRGDIISSVKLNQITEAINNNTETNKKQNTKINKNKKELTDARDGEQTLKARLDRDIEKAKEIYVPVEGSHISTDSSVGYAKDVEILGNTIQDPNNLADIRSVGDKVEGQDVDEIEVSSVRGDGNLVEYIELNGVIIADGKDYTNNKYVRTNYITVEPNQTYYIKPSTNVLYRNCGVYFYDSNKSYLGYKSSLTSEFTTVANTKFIRLDMQKADDSANTQEDIKNCDFVVSKCRVSEYIPHQTDKKRLLYYNEETQAWEKPILREWDSVEKHANGKYYYHQRSGEVVLNGSESWIKPTSQPTSGTHTRFIITNFPPNVIQAPTSVLCDKYNNQKVFNESSVGIYVDKNLNITVNGIIELETFKSNLQTNPITVVYQLAQEKVYECTNIDLITYANETNYIVESGPIVPKSILKVMCNINNVVRELQQKVSNLEGYIQYVMIDALNNALNE